MGQIVPEPVERYLAALNRGADPALVELARRGTEKSIPIIDAEVGMFLRVLARSIAASRILEIGTAIGYSGVWLAGGLAPGGLLLTVELDRATAEEARRNFAAAGLADRVSVIVGDASRMIAKIAGPFDLIFQDGDKHQYGPMLDRLVDRLRPGGLLVTDNVLWDGEVVPGFTAAPKRPADETQAIAAYNEQLAAHPALMTSTLPLRDGLSISVKT
jgi:predicted O-methyltransferase YrrM